ncbi:MAG: EAL domain-containing protein [Spirochaetes bacterium]|nr:EAL domain-containing protein [Spirochaetota bacterium]
MNTTRLIRIIENKCVNCHRCIAVCPVKYCNIGSGKIIQLNHSLCIGCGKCITACTHGARLFDETSEEQHQSDLSHFFKNDNQHKKIIAVVDPVIAVHLPHQELQLNSWLKSKGIKAVYDTSYGAQWMMDSYANFLNQNPSKFAISSFCPIIVSYLELYQPELLPYLIPVESALIHMIKMIQQIYEKDGDYQLLVISPCLGQKREYTQTNIYYLTIQMIMEYLSKEQIQLNDFNPLDYDTPPVDQGIFVSTPGGITNGSVKQNPELADCSRIMGGINQIIHYLKGIGKEITANRNSCFLDALSCKNGCACGPGTPDFQVNPDAIAFYLHQKQLHEQKRDFPQDNDFLKPPVLNQREFQNLSNFNKLKIPTPEELKIIYESMNKIKPDDFKNCAACGYHKCEDMAVAIYNNLNRAENCHFFITDKLQYIMYHDQLTGLKNRTYFLKEAEDILKITRRSNNKAYTYKGFLIIDIDNFKDINSTLGLEFGDSIILKTKERIIELCRESDFLYRIGGDEFLLLLNILENEEDAAIIANRILQSFQTPFTMEDSYLHLEACIGISLFPQNGQDVHTLLKNAESALNEAKKEKNTYRFFAPDMQKKAEEKITIIQNLREAIRGDQFQLYYQPQMTLDGKIVGAEALIRWNHPELGYISPAVFIPYAEDTGLIIQIGEWVILKACSDFKNLEQIDLEHLNISVNISSKQFKDPSLMDKVDNILTMLDYKPRKLHLEITESSLVENLGSMIKSLNTICSKGARLSLDDFGTGYSSLSYIRNLPINILKIDKAFINLIEKGKDKEHLVDTIINMAKGLDLDVVAEGIEQKFQLDYFKKFNYNIIVQGNYFSKPLPIEKFVQYARKYR